MKEYIVYYREKRNVNGEEFECVVTVNNKKEARLNFQQWDNQNNKYTITRIERA